MKSYLKLMRIHHYIKNGLIFLPVFFNQQFFTSTSMINTWFGFVSFCLLSSAIYTLNDINDVELDRNHPVKKNRPIASGKITIRNAWIFFGVLLSGSILSLSVLKETTGWTYFWSILYFILNVGYSNGLKNIPLVDIVILVMGFLLRILFGASLSSVAISNWLYLTVLSGSFYLGFGKRRNELIHCEKKEVRQVLKYYSESFLDHSMTIFMTLAIVFYSLWCMDLEVINRVGSDLLVCTVPIVILIFLKYSLNIEHHQDGDPVEVIIKDKILLVLIFLLMSALVCILYI